MVCAVLHQYRPRPTQARNSGRQFHPYRRLWATERKHLPIQDVAAAGGWKTVETVQRLYQLADGATTLAAVEGGK